MGRVVEVITLRHYLHDDPYHQADVSVPQIQTGSQAGQAVNAQVQADTDRLIAAFEADMAEAGYQGLDVQYAVVTDTADWLRCVWMWFRPWPAARRAACSTTSTSAQTRS